MCRQAGCVAESLSGSRANVPFRRPVRRHGFFPVRRRRPVASDPGGEAGCHPFGAIGRPGGERAQPAVLPAPMPRRFVPDQRNGADLVCAELHFDGGAENPIVAALPEVVFLPLDSIAGTGAVLATLFDEAFSDNCGRHVVVDRLFEVVLVQLLRHLLEAGELRAGMLAGLAHSKLRKALAAMHEQPAREWSLARLAGIAGMSRSVFAGNFRDIVGCTAGAYLQGWRIRLAQQALRQGKRLKMIAIEVGYGSEAALSRAFKAQCGVTPRAWRQSLAAD
nr:AraC family transcriptional regulator [Chromobacterium violaceum]